MKRRRLAVGVGDVVDAVLVDLQVVGHRRQRAELHAELVLGGGHLVVVLLDLDAHRRHRRRASRSACPAASRSAAPGSSRPWCAMRWPRLPLSYSVSELVGSSMASMLKPVLYGVGREAHVVEDEELGLRAEDRPCRRSRSTSGRPRPSWRSSAGRGCRARRSAARGCRRRSTSVVCAKNGSIDRGRRVGHQRHVGLVDRLPAGDRGAVEHQCRRRRCPRRSGDSRR